jgi:PAS domain S-box-containing protein
VVDDDPDFAELTATFLTRHEPSIEAETVHDAEAGLERLTNAEFDCVVSDYDMPGNDGLEFLAAVDELDTDLPFILFTGKGSESIASRAISAGVTDYLQKKGGSEQYERLANRIVHAVRSRRAERTAERSEAHLGAVLESLTDVVITVDESSRVQYVNQAVESVFGYTPAEVTDEPLTMLMPERLRDRHLRSFRRYVESGERMLDWTSVEFPGLHRAGHELSLSLSFGEFEVDGRTYFTGVIRDVSDRTTRERELVGYETVVAQLPVAVWMIDTDGVVRFANRAFTDWLPADHDTVVGRYLLELLPTDRVRVEDASDSFERTLETVLRGEREVVPIELTSPDADTEAARAVRVFPVRREGTVVGAVGVGRTRADTTG